MLAKMLSKELVALDMSDFDEAIDLVEVMAAGINTPWLCPICK